MATTEGYLRCPGCKALILPKDIEAHEASDHKGFKQEVTPQVAKATQADKWYVQIDKMIHAYPRAAIYFAMICLTAGYLLAWYSIFR